MFLYLYNVHHANFGQFKAERVLYIIYIFVIKLKYNMNICLLWIEKIDTTDLRQLLNRSILQNITRHPNLKAPVHFSEIPCTFLRCNEQTEKNQKAPLHSPYETTTNSLLKLTDSKQKIIIQVNQIYLYYICFQVNQMSKKSFSLNCFQ